MTDYAELKRLAETANAVTGDVSVEVTLASEPGPNQAEVDAVTAFVGAATPAQVLALIADSERNQRMLLAACMDMGAIGNALDADMNSDGEALLEMVVELKAEKEAAQALIGTVVIASGATLGQDLVEVIESLRKDAERYRYLRQAQSGYIEVVEWIGPHATGMTGEDLDALLDTAMGKGEQS